MLKIRKSQERGHANHGWLDSYHTFSFADYFDPAHMGFSALRVINEDRVEPGQGFGTHPHRDMEIVTYVLEGSLQHRDSMGNGSIIKAGDIQYMSAGSGVTHSEFNPSAQEGSHFLQIWLMPNQQGGEPRYGERNFTDEQKRGRWVLLVSPDGRDGSIDVRQDASLFVTVVKQGDRLPYALEPARRAYLHVARGRVTVNGTPLAAGDGVAVADESELVLESDDWGEVLLFDLP
ncbi:pirin family protein [bacterium]|nr:pirin family protein [bacterium]